jgi:hypothetical protein
MFIDLRHRDPPNQVTVGIRVIQITAAGYLAMHVFFFGVPHFSLHTGMGRAEIGMAVTSLTSIALGAYGIYRELQSRRH